MIRIPIGPEYDDDHPLQVEFSLHDSKVDIDVTWDQLTITLRDRTEIVITDDRLKIIKENNEEVRVIEE